MIRYEPVPPAHLDGAGYQRWLRQRIAARELMQTRRIELNAERKKQLDETVERAQREIDGLKQQLTMGVVK